MLHILIMTIGEIGFTEAIILSLFKLLIIVNAIINHKRGIECLL